MPGAVYFHRQFTAVIAAGTFESDRSQVIITFADKLSGPQDGRAAGLRRGPARPDDDQPVRLFDKSRQPGRMAASGIRLDDLAQLFVI